MAVTVDWTQCPNAQGMMSFYGSEGAFANVYFENGPLQTIYLPSDEIYCITFEINSPLCIVSTTYSHGVVTHYDPHHCEQTLLSNYTFNDNCQ